MEDLLDWVLAPKMDTPYEEESVLVQDLMNAIAAPPLLTIDLITRVIDVSTERQHKRERLRTYVDLITAHPELSYAEIRLELQLFANSCEPPITHMQARTLAFVEKRRRSKAGDTAAKANLDNHIRHRWRLPYNIEDHLWRWIALRWAAKETPQAKSYNLVQELATLSENLHIPRASVEVWVKTVILAIAKMQRGGVEITGLPVRIVVRAAIDDTAP